MSPRRLSREIVTDRLAAIEEMLAGIERLPLHDRTAFFADERNTWAAESCLRRALEGLLDLGRYILAKSFAVAVTEYKAIARALGERQVLAQGDVALLVTLAGYRNRLVHFYHEVEPDELFGVCSDELDDVKKVADAFRAWIRDHPDLIEDST